MATNWAKPLLNEPLLLSKPGVQNPGGYTHSICPMESEWSIRSWPTWSWLTTPTPMTTAMWTAIQRWDPPARTLLTTHHRRNRASKRRKMCVHVRVPHDSPCHQLTVRFVQDPSASTILLFIQAFVTFIFAPVAFFWVFGVISDIIINWQTLRPACVGTTDAGDLCFPNYDNYTSSEFTCEPGCTDRGETPLLSLEVAHPLPFNRCVLFGPV